MFDSHVHSNHSHDAVSTIEEICRSAIEKGILGVSVCDHADMWFYERQNTHEGFRACITEVLALREKYEGKLKLLQGIEMAEYLFAPEKAELLYRLGHYDVILGSVHSVSYADITDAYSRVDFGTMAKEKIHGFLREYFSKMREMIEKTDFDVLTHLTCPLRYINGKYERGIDIFCFEEEIREIFRMIIEPLEIDCEMSVMYENCGFLSVFFDTYQRMGGTLVTIGSDAHTPYRIGNALSETKKCLHDIGFSTYCYYEKREPQFIVL